MSKERLEKVEEIVNIITTTESEEEYNSAVNAFILSHMDWTLERIKELEGENRILRTVAESNKYIGEQYLEENKRYREAIEDIKNAWKVTDTYQEYMDTVHDIIKDLEGDSNE